MLSAQNRVREGADRAAGAANVESRYYQCLDSRCLVRNSMIFRGIGMFVAGYVLGVVVNVVLQLLVIGFATVTTIDAGDQFFKFYSHAAARDKLLIELGLLAIGGIMLPRIYWKSRPLAWGYIGFLVTAFVEDIWYLWTVYATGAMLTSSG